jgi:beta-lactamase regulating signal transducer with metallopeptidase domain
MGMALRTIVLSLAWFAAINASASLLAWMLAARPRNLPLPDRARRLMLVRILPGAASLMFAALVFLPSHLLLEPRDAAETLGILWLVLATSGALLLTRSAVRAWRTWRIGRRLLSATHQRAGGAAGVHELEGFAGVSLAGVLHPRILIGAEVTRELTPAELEVAVAHERAHGDAFDNLTRWLILCAPDFFGGSSRAKRLEADWHETAESLADARAVAGDRMRALHLAAALVKVARLSAATPFAHAVPAWSTLNDPPLLERRVRELLAEAPAPPIPPRRPIFVVASIGVAFLSVAALGAESLHHLTEQLIALLP